MTDADRIELLQEVARVAPKEMGAEFVEDAHSQHEVQADGTVRVISTTGKPYVIFRMEKYNTYPRLYLDDSVEAEDDPIGCFAMLDAMEARVDGVDWETWVVLSGSYGDYACRRWECQEDDALRITAEGFGSTRAEAVARAFVQVFGGEA